MDDQSGLTLPLRTADAVAPFIAFLREPERGVVELVIGTGDHSCQVYRLNRSQLEGLAVDATRMALRKSAD